MARNAESSVQAALASWDTAREQVANGRLNRAGMSYQKGLNYFLLCVYLTRVGEARSSQQPRPGDLMPVFHAIGSMGREGVPVMERASATRPARLHGRTTLAASHLADPTGGRPDLVGGALAAEAGSRPRLDLNGDGPLSAAERIAGAAQARLLLATLLTERPELRLRIRQPWVVDLDGPVSFARYRRQFKQAVLPSCAHLTADEEPIQLARESVELYAALGRVVPEYAPAGDEAKSVLARIRS
jgi:hypothetical protein